MVTLFTLLVVVGIVAYVAKARSGKAPRQLAARSTAHIAHLRTGEFPSTCSWCKNTTLARKLLIFENTPTGWAACDVMSRLWQSHPAEVEIWAPVLVHDHPRWRRFCTERCTREFVATESAPAVDAFVPCEYCSVRFPVSIARCNNCGAARR